MDVYVVRFLSTVIGVSARLQGGELIKANWIEDQTRNGYPILQRGFAIPPADRRVVLEKTTVVENFNLQDDDR